MDVRPMTPEEVQFLGDALKYKKLYEDTLLQFSEIRKILVGATSDTVKVIRIEGVLMQTEKHGRCCCRPMTYQEGLDGKCIKCGLPIETRICVGCGGSGTSVLPSRDGKMRCHKCDNPQGQDH